MKNRTRILLAVALIVIGGGLLLYPPISSAINTRRQTRVIDSYEQAVSQMTKQQTAEEKQQAADFNAAWYQQQGTNTPTGTYGAARQKEYDALLNQSDAMAYLSIPSLRLRLPIRHGLTEKNLETGVGHMEGTSLPVGGENTHAVLSAHRGLPGARLFTDLDQLTVGDTFYLYVLDEVLAYRVDQIKTVLPDQTQDLAIVPGEDYVTLVTCTPYGINSHRLIIRGTRVPYVPGEMQPVKRRTRGFWWTIGLVAVAFIGLSGALWHQKRRKIKEGK